MFQHLKCLKFFTTTRSLFYYTYIVCLPWGALRHTCNDWCEAGGKLVGAGSFSLLYNWVLGIKIKVKSSGVAAKAVSPLSHPSRKRTVKCNFSGKKERKEWTNEKLSISLSLYGVDVLRNSTWEESMAFGVEPLGFTELTKGLPWRHEDLRLTP